MERLFALETYSTSLFQKDYIGVHSISCRGVGWVGWDGSTVGDSWGGSHVIGKFLLASGRGVEKRLFTS